MGNINQFVLPRCNLLLLCLASVSLSACGSSDKNSLDANSSMQEAFKAATSPLDDLNLRRQEIPPLLSKIAANPYAHPIKATCASVREEVNQIDALLGPDITITGVEYTSADGAPSLPNVDEIELPEMPEGSEVVNQAGKMAKSHAIDVIREQTDILPFRSIIRKITGADRHQKRVNAAYDAGKLRRAYLKGFAADRFGLTCLAPPKVMEAKAGIISELLN